MSKFDEAEMEAILQRGLRQLPVPDASTDFDSRVRARLQPRLSWWLLIRAGLRPMLAPAAFSLSVTLAALIVSSAPRSSELKPEQPRSAGNIARDPLPGRMQSIDQELEQIDRDTPTLGGFRAPHRPVSPGSERTHEGRHGASGLRAPVRNMAQG